MTEPAGPSKPRGNRPRRLLWPFLILVTVIVIMLATGVPQRALLRAVLKSAVNARVEVDSVSVVGGLTIPRLALYERGQLAGSPALVVEGLSMDYRLWPRDGRHIPDLSVEWIGVDLDKLRRILPENRHMPDKKRTSSRSKSFESFIPEYIDVESIKISSTTPSYAFETTGLEFTATFESARRFEAFLYGEGVKAALTTRAGRFSREVSGGTVNIALTRDGAATTVDEMVVDLPGVLELSAKAAVSGREIALDIGTLTAWDVDLSRADPADLPVPFAFRRLDLSGSRIQGEVKAGPLSISLPETNIRVAAEDLVLGAQGAEYYQGDLGVEIIGAPGEQADYALTATLNHGQKISASFEGHHLAFTAHAGLEGWTREDVLEALPANMRGGVSYLWLLERVYSASLDIDWKLPELKAAGAIDALFVVNGEERPGRLEFAGEGPVMPQVGRAFEVSAKAQLAGGEVAVASTVADAPARITLTLRDVNPALWLYTLTERDMLDDLNASFSGSVAIDPGDAPKQLKAAVDLQATPFGYGPVSMPEGETLKIAGLIEADFGTFGYIRGSKLAFRINEDTALVLRDWNFPMEDFSLSGDVDFWFDLAMLEHTLPGSGLRGRLELHGPLVNDRGYMNLEFKGAIEGLGCGDYAAPYGEPIQAAGMLSFDNLNGRLTGQDFAFDLPEATSLTSDGWTFEGSTGKLTVPFRLETDFQPLVPMGLLDKVVGGHGAVTGTLVYAEDGAQLEAGVKTAADTVVVGGAWAALTGLEAEASLVKPVGASMAGTGNVKTAEVAAMGAVFEQVEGLVSLESGVLRAPELKGSLYGGAATANVEAGLTDESLPVRLGATMTGVDLGLFTGTLGVPAVEMTGRANGKAMLKMDYATGIRDFGADLRASEDFSVNTYLLEQLLAMQFAKQYAGERQMEKIRARILGKEDRRSFDSGRLVLNYQEDRIGGQASLKSENLDLTVDLKIDKEALLSALEFAQENRIDRLGLAAE